MGKQPTVTVGLRLPPTTKSDLVAVLDALEAQGDKVRREDLVGALLQRAAGLVANPKELAKLAADARAHRVRAKAQGF